MLSQILSTISSPFKFLSSSRPPSYSNYSGEMLSVKIIALEFGVARVSIPQDETILNVKKIIFFSLAEEIESFKYGSSETEEVLASIKLIRVETKTELKDADNLSRYGIKNNEEIFFAIRRVYNKSPMSINENVSGPTEDEIIAKTCHLPSPNTTPIFKIRHLLMQDDLRKVFITLARESAYILAASRCSIKILSYYRQKINNYMSTIENAFKVMYKLGFSHDIVKQAMMLNANNYKLALDWLIDNVEEHENLRLSKSPRTSLISDRRMSILSARFDLSTSMTVKERLDGLLSVVEFYSEMDEPVYDQNLIRLAEMGYDVEEAREALRIVKNNVGAACDFLAERTDASIMELRVGLDKSSGMYDVLMKEVAIHQLLSYPETFVYLNELLEEHVIEWDPDLENGQLMREIITTYHHEKHSMAINQFNKPPLPTAPLT